MLTVTVLYNRDFVNNHLRVILHENDIQLVKDIRDKIGNIEAMKVFRLMAKCSLIDAKKYVDGLK